MTSSWPAPERAIGRGTNNVPEKLGGRFARTHRPRRTGPMRGPGTTVLLCGGDKGTQARDIRTAKRLAEEGSV